MQINGGPLSWQDGRIGVPEAEPGFTLGVWQCRPHSRGTVTLKSPRAEDAPAIAPRFLTERADEDCVVRGMRLARRWMAAEPLRGIVAGEARPGPAADSDDALLAFAKATGGTVYHPSCTVRMGGDATAPLDARLRLRGIDGLRVVDASVFPDIPVCNINATVLRVAEKAADLIARGHARLNSAARSFVEAQPASRGSARSTSPPRSAYAPAPVATSDPLGADEADLGHARAHVGLRQRMARRRVQPVHDGIGRRRRHPPHHPGIRFEARRDGLGHGRHVRAGRARAAACSPPAPAARRRAPGPWWRACRRT